MTYDAKVLNASNDEKIVAFEWLRDRAINGGPDWRKAAIALEEWARLGDPYSELPPRFHLNQEPLDFASARNLLRQARTDLMLALALLRELNDALSIPERFQARVDTILDRAEEKP